MTLTQALLPTATFGRKALLVLAGSALISLGAQITVPMWPVPMTLQTLAIALVGLTYGSRLAALTVLAYLAEGAAGLPVFAGGAGGLVHLMGPTAGFLWGFVPMAWLTGLLVEKGLDRGVLRLFLAASIPNLLLYIPGVWWLSQIVGKPFGWAVEKGMLPFILGDMVKCAIAALIVSGTWKILAERKSGGKS